MKTYTKYTIDMDELTIALAEYMQKHYGVLDNIKCEPFLQVDRYEVPVLKAINVIVEKDVAKNGK
jgi:hypothetical protein